MSKVVTETLAAVTEFLTQKFPNCDVRRTYLPNVTIANLPVQAKPRISVSLYDRSIHQPTRSEEYENIVYVDVAVVKKIKRDDDPEIDSLVDIVGEIFEVFFQTKAICCEPYTYHFEEVEFDDARQVCFEDFLSQGLFCGAMQLTVKTNRSRG